MSRVLVRRVFFTPAADAASYAAAVEDVRARMEKDFPDASQRPLWSVVAQAPFDAEGRPLPLDWENQYVSRGKDTLIEWKEIGGVRYALLTTGTLRELYFGAGGWNLPDMPASVPDQPAYVFGVAGRILSAEGFRPDEILRQWNYVEGITETTGGVQHYQALNDARSAFYASASWEGGYPAATGIGTAAGGFGLEINAVSAHGDSGFHTWPIDNPFQVAAHRYSGSVLKKGAQAEKTTPKFERARAVAFPRRSTFCYISGTAAIRSENSLGEQDVVEQTRTTLLNIYALIMQVFSLENYLTNVRVYVKRPEDVAAVSSLVKDKCVTVVWLLADVCRPELLVEIEGVAIDYLTVTDYKIDYPSMHQ